jgi:hypothetical protein
VVSDSLFATISGAHLYGFPSVDSDVDVRGCFRAPLADVVGLVHPPETVDPSVMEKLSSDLELMDFFIPGSVAFLNDHDLDLSGCSPLILPDQDGQFPHVIVATGKQGTIYVLNRDNLGLYVPNDPQIIQELVGAVGSMRGSPAYWNGRLYFSAKADFLKVFSVSGGMMSTAPIVSTPLKLTGAHAPSISANGNRDGLVWELNGGAWNSRSSSWVAGAVARINLFHGLADKARLAEARVRAARRALDRDKAETMARLDVEIAIARLEAAQASEAVGRAAVDRAREFHRIVRDRYESGLTDAAMLLRSADAVQQADTQQIAARVNVITATATLQRAIGRP